jgi:3',5'-cyclic AMP phosphodiesterase CpdA
MRIAHFSDLHLLSLEGVPTHRFLNKRFTGWANLRLKRGHVHKASYVRAIAREIAKGRIDHVVVTGDLTNLSLEPEFDLARSVLRDDLGIEPEHVTIVPGNHDLYTRGALTSRRFERYFAAWMKSDLPELAVDVGGGRFPIVKLRGAVAIIALSSAVPRPPFVAAGELGHAQLEALARVLAHPEVARRMPVIAIHHPVLSDWSRMKLHVEGLRDAPALVSVLVPQARGLVLHGHLHRRVVRAMATPQGRIQQVGATSASLHDDAPGRMAGFNLYEIDARGLSRIEAAVLEPATGSFAIERITEEPENRLG